MYIPYQKFCRALDKEKIKYLVKKIDNPIRLIRGGIVDDPERYPYKCNTERVFYEGTATFVIIEKFPVGGFFREKAFTRLEDFSDSDILPLRPWFRNNERIYDSNRVYQHRRNDDKSWFVVFVGKVFPGLEETITRISLDGYCEKYLKDKPDYQVNDNYRIFSIPDAVVKDNGKIIARIDTSVSDSFLEVDHIPFSLGPEQIMESEYELVARLDGKRMMVASETELQKCITGPLYIKKPCFIVKRKNGADNLAAVAVMCWKGERISPPVRKDIIQLPSERIYDQGHKPVFLGNTFNQFYNRYIKGKIDCEVKNIKGSRGGLWFYPRNSLEHDYFKTEEELRNVRKILVLDHLPFESKKNGIDENSFRIVQYLKDGERLGPCEDSKEYADQWIKGPAFIAVPRIWGEKYSKIREKRKREIKYEFNFAIVVRQMADLRIEIPPAPEDDVPVPEGTSVYQFNKRLNAEAGIDYTMVWNVVGLSLYDKDDNEIWNYEEDMHAGQIVVYDSIPEGWITPDKFTFVDYIPEDRWLGTQRIRDKNEWLRDFIREGTLEKHGYHHLRGSIYYNGYTGERYDLSLRDFPPFDYNKKYSWGPGYLFKANRMFENDINPHHNFVFVRNWKNDGSWDPSLFEDKTPEAKPEKKGLFHFRKKNNVG